MDNWTPEQKLARAVGNKFSLGQKGVSVAISKASELEAKGWRAWLTTIFPFAFEDEFSADHEKYWELRWSILLRIREQKKYVNAGLVVPAQFVVSEDEWVTLFLLGRGLGKSATLEASAVMRGAILDGGYCLYTCEAQDQAEEHIGNCKILIDHDESRLAEFYPNMVIEENAVVNGMKLKDRSDLFITKNGWICRAKGLNARLRGLRIGNRRPDDIKIDDIDGVNDSMAVSRKKLKQITSSVIPTQARRWSTIDLGQNLIIDTGVANNIYTGKTDALGARTVIGVTNTFKKFVEGEDYVSYLDDKGKIRYRILPTAEPTWEGVDIAQAQKFLNDSGIDTFLAEYQNQFEHQKTTHVFHEYNEERHIVTWSDFERVFGVRYIPQHWKAKATSDIGYSKESLSAWGFYATSAQNSPLPNHYFLYRSLTFCQDSIDDQAEKIWEEMFPDYTVGKRHLEASQSFTNYPELFRLLKTKPRCANLLSNYSYNPHTDKFEPKFKPDETDEDKALFYVRQAQKTFTSQIVQWVISHEKTGEQKTLAKMYGIPVQKTKHYGADAGVSEANHLLRGDYTKPHPFYKDEIDDATGLYRLGCPYIFFLVDDDQKTNPRDDRGLKMFRQQIANQRWTQEKLGEQGLTKTIPIKFESDHPDEFRMFAVDYIIPAATAKTKREKVEDILSAKGLDGETINKADESMQERLVQQRMMALQEIQMAEKKKLESARKYKPIVPKIKLGNFRR